MKGVPLVCGNIYTVRNFRLQQEHGMDYDSYALEMCFRELSFHFLLG